MPADLLAGQDEAIGGTKKGIWQNKTVLGAALLLAALLIYIIAKILSKKK